MTCCHVTVSPSARPPARPSAPEAYRCKITTFGNPNATRGFFGGKSCSHPCLVKQKQFRKESIKTKTESGNCFCILVFRRTKLKGDVTRHDSQQQFLAQHRDAMLEQCCNYSKQCRNNVATPCCGKNCHCESSRVIREKERQRARARDSYKIQGRQIMLEEQHESENERQWKKVNKNTYDSSSIKRVTRKLLEVSRCSRANERQRNVQKNVLHVRSCFFVLIRPIVVFSSFLLPSPLKVMLHGTIRNDDFKRITSVQCWNNVVTYTSYTSHQCCNYSKQCHNNVATLQCCAKNRPCESFRVTSPLPLHDFIFCLNKLQILTRALLLALAKSIY